MRNATGRDTACILTAEDETAAITYGRGSTDGERNIRERRLLAALKSSASKVRVVEQNKTIAGYYWLERRPGNVAFLLDFYVVAEYRGSSLSESILHCALEDALGLGAEVLRLVISENNERALRFFVRSGARVTSRLQGDILRDYQISLGPLKKGSGALVGTLAKRSRHRR